MTIIIIITVYVQHGDMSMINCRGVHSDVLV